MKKREIVVNPETCIVNAKGSPQKKTIILLPASPKPILESEKRKSHISFPPLLPCLPLLNFLYFPTKLKRPYRWPSNHSYSSRRQCRLRGDYCYSGSAGAGQCLFPSCSAPSGVPLRSTLRFRQPWWQRCHCAAGARSLCLFLTAPTWVIPLPSFRPVVVAVAVAGGEQGLEERVVQYCRAWRTTGQRGGGCSAMQVQRQSARVRAQARDSRRTRCSPSTKATAGSGR